MEDIRQAYREMFRVLRPGCWCVIIIGSRRFGPELLDLVIAYVAIFPLGPHGGGDLVPADGLAPLR